MTKKLFNFQEQLYKKKFKTVKLIFNVKTSLKNKKTIF